MFHVKHGVPTTNQLFHVKRRERMRSSGATNRIFTEFMAVWLFHVKHCFMPPQGWQCVSVKLRTGWLSCGGWFLRTVFPPIVAEELVFHVKPENSRKFFLTVGGMRFDFSISHNT